MKFDIKDIKARAKKDFEKTWTETAKLIPEKSDRSYAGKEGRPHALHDMIREVRSIFLSLGYDEVENPLFVPEEEVYLQYGPEAPVILDRCYYLAGLPRPDIGLGNEKIDEIKKINGAVEIEKLKQILREYREGVIEGDNMFEEMVGRLGISSSEAARIIDLFQEFRNITPVAEKSTLRSHMTATWFPTLKSVLGKWDMPVKMFSIGLRFRREQKLDATHLRAHYGASCVIMDPDISLEAGMDESRKVLEALNFRGIRFDKKKATSNYYAPDSEYEIYSGDIEVADCGMYSPVALANYGIEYPVYNIGFGLERILMIRTGEKDVREILYPHIYKNLSFSDAELAAQVSIDRSPATDEGRLISKAIAETASANGDATSPCRFKAYAGPLGGRTVEVYVVEREENTRLLGPAARNGIYVHEGSIFGIPAEGGKLKSDLSEVKEKGARASFGFLEALSDYFAAEIEGRVLKGEREGFVQFKMAKTPGEANIRVSDAARRYITSRNKQISLKGPLFTAVEFRAE